MRRIWWNIGDEWLNYLPSAFVMSLMLYKLIFNKVECNGDAIDDSFRDESLPVYLFFFFLVRFFPSISAPGYSCVFEKKEGSCKYKSRIVLKKRVNHIIACCCINWRSMGFFKKKGEEKNSARNGSIWKPQNIVHGKTAEKYDITLCFTLTCEIQPTPLLLDFFFFLNINFIFTHCIRIENYLKRRISCWITTSSL